MEEDFARANRLGADFFVVHPGSCAPEGKAAAWPGSSGAWRPSGGSGGPTRLLLENQGSRKRDIAADLAELALLADLDRDRVGICLDTCHAFVAGYDLRTGRLADVLALLTGDRSGSARGHPRQRLSGDLGSGLDRHAHIGPVILASPPLSPWVRSPAWPTGR